MTKVLQVLPFLFIPLVVWGQDAHWARLTIAGDVSTLGISPAEEIWVATTPANTFVSSPGGACRNCSGPEPSQN